MSDKRADNGEFNKRKRIVYPMSSQMFVKIEDIEEARQDLAHVIPEPDIGDYEIGIPYQEGQYHDDLERYNRFVKWFGKSEKKSENVAKKE